MRRSYAFALALLVLSLVPVAVSAQTSASIREEVTRIRATDHPGVPDGTLTTITFLADLADREEGRFGPQSQAWRRRAGRYLERVRAGADPLVEEKNRITNRGYRSAASTILQGYAIYLPPNYDPSRAYPLYVAMHGGSSNGNLFLGVLLGNNMDWLTYNQHLWDEYTPRWSPDWIVVAPTGFGQMLWRWMAEQDVLDVIADVQRHYNVDENQIVLGGLSNGGLGAYAIGTRHAWRFSTVMAMAGAPSWLLYAPCNCDGLDLANVRRYSGTHLIENAWNTRWKTYHGRTDTGPMRPQFINILEERIAEVGVPADVTWYDTGHDILYIAHQRGRIYERLAPIRRDPKPREVHVLTGDYRAARQHWVTVTRITDYPIIARVKAVAEGSTITVETSNVTAFSIDLRDAPVTGDTLRVLVDGKEAYSGPRAPLGHVVSLVRGDDGFTTGFPNDPAGELVKRPLQAGPINDAYYERMVHVYGTQNAEHTEALRTAAQRGARGWVLWSWDIAQEVVADTAVTPEMIANAHLVLYGTAGSNSVLERIRDRLPVRVESDAIVVGSTRHVGRDVGTRFIYPSPLAPNRYVLVQGGVSPEAVAAGNNLPEFLPDWVVYDGRTTRGTRTRHLSSRAPAKASGWFDARWQLRTTTADARTFDAVAPTWAEAATVPTWAGMQPPLPLETMHGGDPSPNPARGGRGRHVPIPTRLPRPNAPALPPAPATFLAAEDTQEGRAAREIARRIPTFHNYRATIRGANWVVDQANVFRVRPAAECIAELTRNGVPHRRDDGSRALVPNPVWITGPIGGVSFQMAAANRPFLISCELAAKLPRVAEILRRHDVTMAGVVSAYRDNPYTSFHTMGLALDIATFRTSDGTVMRVISDFEMTPEHETCSAPTPRRDKGQRLLRIACDLAASHLMNSVLTPNYNEGHRDHFHIDARPDDPRYFLR